MDDTVEKAYQRVSATLNAVVRNLRPSQYSDLLEMLADEIACRQHAEDDDDA